MISSHQHQDTLPFLDPPSSPWRIRAREYSRRSHHVKRITVLATTLAIGIPLLLLLRYFREDSPRWVPADTLGTWHAFVESPSTHSPSLPTSLATHSTVDSLVADNLTHDNTTVDPVTFSLIMFSADSASEGAVLMKSILMYSSIPVHFHIICDEEAQTHLEKRLSLVTRPRHDVMVRFYRISWSSMLDRIHREGAIISDHSAGTPGLMKLFIHEILPDTVKKSIFIDTDAFFISDPALLWRHFHSLDPNIAISMPSHPEQSSLEWHNANRICSCVMLLNLERLRELRLMDSSAYKDDHSLEALSPPAFRAMFGQPGPSGHYEGVKLGDQGYWWAIVSHRPDIYEHLSYDWEVSSCLLDMYLTGLGHDDASFDDELGVQLHTLDTPHQGQVILPKLLHFNCLDGTPRYFNWEGWSDPHNSLTRRWHAAVTYHVSFKWLWLNQDQQNITTMTLETAQNVLFADERFSMDVSLPSL